MPQLDNMPIMAQSGEYVVRKEAVDELGKPMMDMINNVDRLGYGEGGLIPEGDNGHSSIDELLAINTLNNQASMEKNRDSVVGVDLGGYQEGAQVIDKRARSGGYSIGVVDPLWNALEKLDSIDELVQSQAPNSPYDFSKYQRSLLDVLDEAGEYTTEDALKMLDEIAKGRAQGGKMHRPRFQDGGTVSFAGSESNLPTLEELYSMAGVMPVGAQKDAFEKAFKYDPSRESSTVAGYIGQMGDLGRSGTSAVGQAGEATRAMGVGFAGSGAGVRELGKARRGAQANYESGMKDTQRRMFENIRGDRESYIQNALAELNRLEGLGGTQEYRSGVQSREIGLGEVGAPSQPPQGSETGGDTIGQRQKGSDGQTYEWNGSVWVLVNNAGSGGYDDDLGGDLGGGGYDDDIGNTSGTFP